MLYVVCYDISNDGVRERMAKLLLAFGSRIQESVFECPLNTPLYERMMVELQRVPLEASDRVRVYRMCEPCVERIQIYDEGEVTQEPEYYLV